MNTGSKFGPRIDPRLTARFVGREFKWKSPEMENSFAGTPPLESLNSTCCHSSKRAGGVRRGREERILVFDVSRAHFHPKSRRELYLRLPAEDSKFGYVGKLLCTCTEHETQPTLEMSSSTMLQLIKDTTLECHHHACTSIVGKTATGGDMGMIWCSKVKTIGLTNCRIHWNV